MPTELVWDLVVDMFEGEVDLAFGFAVVGLVVLVGEAFVPGGTLMVLGIGLMASGVTGVLFGIDGLLPLALMAGVYGGIAFYLFRRYDFFGERGPQTSDRHRLTGETGKVVTTVTPDDGKVKLDSGGFDPNYTARSATGAVISEGTRIRVVDPRGGNVLLVEPLVGSDADGSDAPGTDGDATVADGASDGARDEESPG